MKDDISDIVVVMEDSGDDNDYRNPDSLGSDLDNPTDGPINIGIA